MGHLKSKNQRNSMLDSKSFSKGSDSSKIQVRKISSQELRTTRNSAYSYIVK